MDKGVSGLMALLLAAAVPAVAAQEEVPQLPSGLTVSLFDLFIEEQQDGARWARFRFLLPELARGTGFDAVEADFAVLCQKYALPRLVAAGETVQQVIVSLSSDVVEFGATQPDVVQYFEAYRVENDLCIWEAF